MTYPTSTAFRFFLIALCLCSASSAFAESASTTLLTFDINMQEEIRAGRFNPQTDNVGIRGNTAPLAWDRSAPLQSGAAGHYRTALLLHQVAKPGQTLQYKLKIDRPGQGQGDGWEEGRNHVLALDNPNPVVQRAFNATPVMPTLSRVGTIEHLPALHSLHIRDRSVQVWLPPRYARDTERRYPVLYLHDGQAMFDTSVTAAEWRMDESAQRLVESGMIASIIIVAIDNTPDRVAEYTPVAGRLSTRPGASTELVGGNAPAYARYVVDELKPQIDRRYRTQPEARFTSVGGSSLGGLVSLWMLAHHPQTFGAAMVVSPSVWWSEGFILRDIQSQFNTANVRPRIWLDIGLQEGEQAVRDVHALHALLRNCGWNASNLRYAEQVDGIHDEASWASRVEDILQFLYGKN